MRRWVILIPLFMQLLNGCVQPDELELDLMGHELVERPCFIAAEEGHCHLVHLVVRNINESAEATVFSLDWHAYDDAGTRHTGPEQDPDGRIGPGQTMEVTLGFDVPAGNRLVNVTHKGPPAVTVSLV